MPRTARLTLPGIALHVIQRGNNRQPCFFNEKDYRNYLFWLLKYNEYCGCKVHAYCLMTNHIHLLLTGNTAAATSHLMKRLGQQYVQYVNRTYKRSGTLWEGRFKSCLVFEPSYLLACYRYIELNPVRAEMVAHPADYPWSSYRTNAQGEHSALIEQHDHYRNLGAEPAACRSHYRALFEERLDAKLIEQIRVCAKGDYALGSEQFANQVETTLKRKATRGKQGRKQQTGQTPINRRFDNGNSV